MTTFVESWRAALVSAMRADSSILVLGQGVAGSKACFGTLTGIGEEFPGRLIETSCSEAAWTGMAIGMALAGLRPMIVYQRVEFALLAMEQIVNNAAKMKFLTGRPCPVVFRMIVGRGWGQGPTHGQSLEPLFAHIPGLRVVMPGTSEEGAELLTAALTGDEPVVYLEHRWLHEIQDGLYETDNGGGTASDREPPHAHQDQSPYSSRVLAHGGDLTIVAYGYMVWEASRAAAILNEIGILTEIISLRTLVPLDCRLIIESVRKTRRLLVVDHGPIVANIGSTITGVVAYDCWETLRAPPAVIGSNIAPLPAARSLVSDYYPTVASIVNLALEVTSATSGDKLKKGLMLIAEERRGREIDKPPTTEEFGPF